MLTDITGSIETLAQGLNIYTLQGLVSSQNGFVLPTLDGQLLQIGLTGTRSILVDLLKAELGVPFGITTDGKNFVVTVSGYQPVHYLVEVKVDGRFSPIANLSETSGLYGAPFGVTMDRDSYIVTLSTDVTESGSLLVRVSRSGKVETIADLSRFGIPFGVIKDGETFIVAQQQGQLVEVNREGKTAVLIDLVQAGLGIPFNLIKQGTDFLVTTNAGLVVRVSRGSSPAVLVDLLKARLGIPSGIAIQGTKLGITTNSGYLLQIPL